MTAPLSRSGAAVLQRLAARDPLLVCVDLDGTVAPIVRDPAAARVPDRTRSTLRRLREVPSVELVLVSGRSADDARRVLGAPVDWVIGNHGFEIARGAGRPEAARAARHRAPVERAATALGPVVARLPGVTLEHKGWTLAVHYRTASPAVRKAVWPAVRRAVRGTGVALYRGKEIVDVRPGTGWDKGTALRALLRRTFPQWARRAGVVYAGDDVTDEHVFRVLPAGAVTIKVGRGRTRARWRTTSPATLARWLERLARAVR